MKTRKLLFSLIASCLIFGTLVNVSSAKTISRQAGIGDTRASFNKAYGHGKSSPGIVRYQHDYILAMFMDRSAYDITLQFESTDRPRRTKAQAVAAYMPMIPSDSIKIKQYPDPNSDGTVIIYRSHKLATHCKKAVFSGAKPGTFLVALQKDSKGYFAVVLGTGDNP